jgi:hypothetical protein
MTCQNLKSLVCSTTCGNVWSIGGVEVPYDHHVESTCEQRLLNFIMYTKHDNVCSLVENMVKKNRSRFPITVLLTTLICSH